MTGVSPAIMTQILASLDYPEKLLGLVLDQALIQAGALRGMVFDHEQIIRQVGYTHADKVNVWMALERLLVECDGIRQSPQQFFEAEWDGMSPVVGVAGTLKGPSGHLAVVAVEKDGKLRPEEIANFAEWLEIASMPVSASLTNARLSRLVQREPLRLRDLPLEKLAELPNLQEIEMLLISEALRRNGNSRSKAAKVLGLSREGLRRKILRAATGE